MKIEVLGHASVKLTGDKVIYVDPYNIKEELHDADYIFITHDHYDHYDEKSIEKVRNNNTKIIVPLCLKDKEHNLLVDGYRYYEIDGIKFNSIPSYNINKSFHPREKYYVGYNILLENEYYYIMGDTDRTPEAEQVKTNYCFVPIGGTYTMNVDEAADYINSIHPDVAIPIHYGTIAGDISMGEEFKNKVNDDIKVEVLIGEENGD